MLGALLWSFTGAFLCTMIILGIAFVVNRKEILQDYDTRIKWGVAVFVTVFLTLIGVFYVFCMPQTILSVIRWIWVPLVIIAMLYIIPRLNDGFADTEFGISCVVAIISGLICFGGIFAPVQNLIYVHDMENIDVTYAISADEILAKIELTTNNEKSYKIESPEMRKIKGTDVAVYHITDNTGEGRTEYIPGYAIQEKNEFPQIISKRIYFDTSYCNKWDALRTIRRMYPTVILGQHKFDIDDEWNPYEIYEYREKMFSSNGKDYDIIILNLMDGTCQKYPVAENKIPSWVDFKTTCPR